MKYLLRAIATLNGLSAITASLLIVHWLRDFGRVHLLGLTGLVAMGSVAILAAYSAIQLWRLRPSGRYSAVAFLSLAAAFWGYVLLADTGQPSASLAIRFAVCILSIVTLLTQRARNETRSKADINDAPALGTAGEQ